jgi:preprotein translocase subunit SecB/DNA-binding transcriptional regulator YiaG
MRIDAWHRKMLQRSRAYARAVEELEASESQRIADEILALRMEAGLTQTEVARLAKTTQAMVSRIECAEGNPKLATVERVLAALRRAVVREWTGVGAQAANAASQLWVPVTASSTLGSAAGTKQPGLAIHQVVLEAARFSHRADYLQHSATTPIKDLALETQFALGLSRDHSKGALRLAVRTKDDAKPLYSFELSMVALVEVQAGQANMPLERYAAVSGMSLLYPFLREAVANLTQRGRFGPVWLQPLNVAAAVEGTRGPAGLLKAARRLPARRSSAR